MSRQLQRRRQNAISSAYYDIRSFYANRRSLRSSIADMEGEKGPNRPGADWGRAGRYARDAISIKLRAWILLFDTLRTSTRDDARRELHYPALQRDLTSAAAAIHYLINAG